ncbi:MAG: coiled coil domain-containing protein [Gammaproteobacteria bacterium]|nr:coiled coil domain-containing protein [Gammaproteobacteria bacterium]
MNDKKAYEQKMEARLEEWAAEIDKLKARAKKSDAEAKIEINNQIDEAKEMQQKVEDRLDELRSTSDDAWSDIKQGLDAASASLGASLRSAVSRFS